MSDRRRQAQVAVGIGGGVGGSSSSAGTNQHLVGILSLGGGAHSFADMLVAIRVACSVAQQPTHKGVVRLPPRTQKVIVELRLSLVAEVVALNELIHHKFELIVGRLRGGED